MTTLTVLVTMLAAGAAGSAVAEAGSNPCSILSDTVYRQVAGAGRSGRHIATLPASVPAPVVCTDTARAVSAGFSKAMVEMNLYVTWPTSERARGDVCLSHDLSRCYPSWDPFLPGFGPDDAAFVVQQWESVQASIGAAMPAGTASDISRFDPVSVGYRLQRSLRVGNDGRRLYH